MALRTGTGPRLALGIALALLAAEAHAGDAAPAPVAPSPPAAPEPPPTAVADEPTLPQWGRGGPFEVQDPFVLAELRIAPYARSPRTLAPFELEVGARGVWENNYGIADDYPVSPGTLAYNRLTLDDESRDLTLVARMGVLPRIELGAELDAVHYRGGGVLDGFIMGFHKLTDQGMLRRDERPKNGYLVAGTEPDGRAFDFEGRGVGLGDGSASVRFLALEGGDYHPAVAFTLRAFLPTASQKFGHAHELAATLGLDASKRVLDLPLVVYAGGAYTRDSASTVGGLSMRQDRLMGYVGFEWEIRSWLSFVIHFWEETPRESKLWRHTDIPYKNEIEYVAAGFKWKPVDGLRIELGILENFHDPNTTGDFGFLLNIWYDFGVLRGS
jgi:hypothetical protein